MQNITLNGFERYIKNSNAFTKEEVQSLFTKKVAIVGCGGLGGYVIECLARFGIGNLTLIDGDVFSVTNLNRQRFSTEETINKPKVYISKEEIFKINSQVKVNANFCVLKKENAKELLLGHDLIIDCLDNIESRFVLSDTCKELLIPFVHGAIGGFYGQVSFVMPYDDLLYRIYKKDVNTNKNTAEKTLGNPSYIPMTVSSIMCSEAIKYLTNKGELLINKLLYIDLFYNDFEIYSFNDQRP